MKWTVAIVACLSMLAVGGAFVSVAIDVHSARGEAIQVAKDQSKALADFKVQLSGVVKDASDALLGKDGLVTNANAVAKSARSIADKADKAADLNLKIAQSTNARASASAELTEKALASAVRTGEHFEKKTLPDIDVLIANVNAAVGKDNTEGARAMINAGTVAIEGLSGPTGPVAASAVAIQKLQVVEDEIATVVGKPGATGTVGGIIKHGDNIAANVDLAVYQATHPAQVPFWKMFVIRMLGVVAPELARDILTRAMPPREKIINLPNASAPAPATAPAPPKQ